MKIDIANKLAAFFPIGSPLVEITVETGATGDWMPESVSDRAIAIVNLLVFEESDGCRSLRDMKQQELNLGFPALYDNTERVAAFFTALSELVAAIPAETAEKLMPIDLLLVDTLKLKRAHTQAGFDKALRAKSRLGQYL